MRLRYGVYSQGNRYTRLGRSAPRRPFSDFLLMRHPYKNRHPIARRMSALRTDGPDDKGQRAVFAVVAVVLWFGAEGQADWCDHAAGREVTQVLPTRRKDPDGVVATVGDVEVASFVEGYTTRNAQPRGGEVAQVPRWERTSESGRQARRDGGYWLRKGCLACRRRCHEVHSAPWWRSHRGVLGENFRIVLPAMLET